ncbi:MAG TPA: S41 family peptidase [Candidatus Baltobacteraceae bacterium]|nr:S41 family peptidase [Candidatus Baltobacteraceae bacterium]
MMNPFDRENPAPAVPQNVRARKAVGVYLALVFVVASFLWGYRLGAHETAKKPTGSASGTVEFVNAEMDRSGGVIDFQMYWDLWQLIKDRYAKQPVDERKMFYGALEGMVASLGDPHSVFMEPVATQEFAQELSGKFEGIGAEIGEKKGSLVIIAPLPESPAEKAGLLAGDRIIGIDEVDTAGMTLDDAVSRIRGDKGTKVKLHVLRGDEQEPRVFEIVRDTIAVHSVKITYAASPKGKKLAVIKISHFNEDTVGLFLDAVTQASARGVQGVILDLRNNPGGYLDAAVHVLGEWIPGEIAVSERYSDGSKDDHVADGLGRLSALPTVVLVNGGSASASEIVSGALQDLDKAILIGEQTYGKGSVQDLIDLDDGSSVKLTIAEWLTPKGNNINTQGIAPDYVVERTEKDYEDDKDPQQDAAEAWFDGVIPPAPPSPDTAKKP